MTTATARVLRFSVELPPSALAPNRANGRAWQSTHDDRDTYRGKVYTDALTAWYRQHGTRARAMQQARLSLHFVWCGRRRRGLDLDGAYGSFKQGQDALVRAGVIVDDSWIYLSVGALTAEQCPRGCRCGGRVEVTVEEVSA